DSKACPKRRREQSGACRSTNKRERIQSYLDRSRVGSGIEHNVNPEVFHRRVQIFLNDGIQAMNLIDKEYIVWLQVRQQTGEVTRFIKDRPRSYFDVRLELVGYDMRQGCLAQTRRAVQENVIKGFAALTSRLNKDLDVFDHFLLPGKIAKGQRPKCFLYVLLASGQSFAIAFQVVFSHKRWMMGRRYEQIVMAGISLISNIVAFSGFSINL